MNVHIQSCDRSKLGSQNYLPRMLDSLSTRARPGTLERIKFIMGDESPADLPGVIPCTKEKLEWMDGKPLQFKCSVNYLQSLMAACNGKPTLILEDDVIFTTRFEDKLEVLLSEVPSQEFVLSLYTCQHLRFQPFEQVRPEMFWGGQALYYPACLVPRLLEFMRESLLAWGPGDPVNDVACDMIVQRFCEKYSIPIFLPNPSLVQHIGLKSTGLNPFAAQHTAPRFYEGVPKGFARNKCESFCTFVTENMVHEALLLLESLTLFHPGTPIYVIADEASAEMILDRFPMVNLRSGFVDFAEIAKRERAWMENPDNARLRGKRDPLFGKMLFKIEAVEFALSNSRNTTFCDADVCFLAPLPLLPECDIAIAMHHHSPKVRGRDLEYGVFNAGLVYVANRRVPEWWRRAYIWDSEYCDQECLSDAPSFFDTHILPSAVNYGHWRLWNHSVGHSIDLDTAGYAETARFAGITVGDGIFLHGEPLQSMHVHLFSDIAHLHPANRALKRLFTYALGSSDKPEHKRLWKYFAKLILLTEP